MSYTAGQQLQFTANVYGGTSPYFYSWNFGDGSSGSGNPVTHTYSSAGTYTVTVKVTDSKGQTASASTSISIQSQATGIDVSSYSVCDTSIQNGDYAYVDNQADTGYTGYFTITDVSAMQNDASYANECGETVSQFIQSHPWANGIYYNYSGSSTSSGGTSSGGTSSAINVSSYSVCDTSIQNGDYAYVNNQADTGYTGYFVIINVSNMQSDASYAKECGETVSQFIQYHPWANGIFYKYVGTSPPT